MSLPRLLKKLSRKSLRKRSQSNASTPSVDVQHLDLEVPPLPGPKSATSTVSSFQYVIPSPLPNGSTPYLLPTEPNTPSIPSLAVPNGAPHPSVPPPLPVVVMNGNAVPQDDFSKDLQAAWASATTDPKVSKADKALLKLENGVSGALAKEAQGATMMTTIQTGLEAVGGLEVIEKGLNTFMEGMPVLMNALDEVAKLHPFIGVAVMAFKAVWALEQKRRDNDRKILALHMEMKDMMGVLTQLKNVKDMEETAPDGTTIKGRMQELVKKTAEDIKSCANACDTYSKKKLVVKVLKGPIWEGRLVKFVGIFTQRRGDFEFALSIHTALGVDAANRAIGSVDKTTQEMNAKMDMMLNMFSQFVSPEQKEMARLVEQRGGQAVLNDDKALKDLNDFENKSGGSRGINAASSSKPTKPWDLDDLKDDLHTDPDTAMEQNLAKFSQKLDIQTRQITDEMNRIVERQGDRIISAVTAGPHDKIIDPNVHHVWKEMGWRGSVKARHFVMALRDYFQEDHKHKSADGKPDEHGLIAVDKEDEWALQYISVLRLQPISEAFDDDASGFVTVAEVNAFTTARPLDWSLPRWIAYWAIGQHQVLYTYATKINELLSKMFAIMPKILPVNKSPANMYLETIYEGVYSLTAAVDASYVANRPEERFKSYVEAEEERIRANLEAVKYDIDAADTLELVTGEGRIDRYVFPVMYLLLKRHFEIFRVAQTRTLDLEELWDAGDTMEWVFDAVIDRLELLQSIFKQQKLDLNHQFKGFAFGMYEYMNQPNLLWDPKLVQEAEFPEYTYNDNLEAQDVDATKILNYPSDQELLDFEAYTLRKPEAQNDVDSPNTLAAFKGIFGVWHGFTYWKAIFDLPSVGMLSMVFEPSSPEGEVQHFTATARANKADFKIIGECRVGDEPGTALVSFRRIFTTRFDTQYFTGKWDLATETLTGRFGLEKDSLMHPGAFIFKRNITPEHMCFFPAPVQLENSKARALWAFAISAVKFDIRRSRWAWSYFKERRDRRRRFIELYIRRDGSTTFGPPLTGDEYKELSIIKKSMTAADSRFYHSLAEKEIRATTMHADLWCDNCEGQIGGARITCLICQMKDTFNTVDFCSTPGCIDNRVTSDELQKPHLPHHDLMKVRRVVHRRFFGQTYRDAKEALKQARAFFTSPSDATAEEEEESSDSESDTEDEGGHAPVPLSGKRLSRRPGLAISIPPGAPPAGPSSGLPMSAVSAARQVLGPPCCACNKPVSQPCWYCVQCAKESFICWECDAKGEVSFGSHDFHTHDLVRVQELVDEKDLSVEERLGQLEERFSTVDSRLGRMEALLEQVLKKMG
ncbi:hypothetical protein K438DRAFT_1813864 [Mycena galopus ATCC 62051]|nr:hypothetical protein K438DRAFT_1813864 [Mycena galopus ATCC 62051]